MIKKFLFSRYDFRVNVLRSQTEWRSRKDVQEVQSVQKVQKVQGGQIKLPDHPFHPLTDRDLNTFYWQLQDAGIDCPYKDMDRLLNSNLVPQYHPFREWLSALPVWDGHDRIGHLARRVSHDALWQKVFRRWMLAMVAQWQGMSMQTANSMVPVLVSERQGLGKSTFCRQLLPPELRCYYLDKLDFTQSGEYDKMMAQFALINLDEMDRYTQRAMSKFKAATQMQEITLHSPYQQHMQQSQRLASFIGTTNQRGVLHDRTGSRRFYCVEVERPIRCGRPINYEQLYAQVLELLRRGEPTWFNKSEEAQIQRHNARYYQLTPLQQMLCTLYRQPEPEETVEPLTARQIFDTVARKRPQLVAGRSLAVFAREVTQVFPSTPRDKHGLRYLAVPLRAS